MAIIFCYLLRINLKIFSTCLLSAIAFLLLFRLEEIAHFAVLAGNIQHGVRFTLYQVPFILPLAIPISAAIATFVTMQKLVHEKQWIALQAMGYSYFSISSLFLACGMLLSPINFFITSELATKSHFIKRLLRKELKEINPFILLQQDRLAKLKTLHISYFSDTSPSNERLDDLFCFFLNHGRLQLLSAKELFQGEGKLYGKDLSLILASAKSDFFSSFDPLMIHHDDHLSLEKGDLHDLTQEKNWMPKEDYLRFPQLLARLRAQTSEEPSPKQRVAIYGEIFRRVGLGIAPMTLTLFAFLVPLLSPIRDDRRNVGVFLSGVILFFALHFLMASFAKNSPLLPFTYLLPHCALWTLSMFYILNLKFGSFSLFNRVNRPRKPNR